MKGHLVLLLYFNFLTKIAIYLYHYDINLYYNLRKYEHKFIIYPEAQWIRNLADSFDIYGQDIINDKGLSIKELQLLHNRNDKEYESALGEGNIENSRILFIKFLDEIFLRNYNECLEIERMYHSSMYKKLDAMKQETLNFFESSFNDLSTYINKTFKDLNTCKWGCSKLGKLKEALNISENKWHIFIDTRHLQTYIEDLKLNADSLLRINSRLTYFHKLHEDNNLFLLETGENFFKYDKCINKYLGLSVDRFPLKFFNNNYNDNHLMKNVLHEFTDVLFNKEGNKNVNTNTSIEVNITHLSNLIDDLINIYDVNINVKTHVLFVNLNKILNGDIKCFIAFVSYVFEIEMCKNKLKLDNMKDEYGEEIFKDEILSDIYKLFLLEKIQIKNALYEFEKYVKSIYGLDLKNPGIRSLVKRIYGSINKEETMRMFEIIVHQLLYKKLLIEFKDLLIQIKEKSRYKNFFIKSFMKIFRKPKKDVIFISKHKSVSILLKFFNIFGKNNFICRLGFNNEDIMLLLKKLKEGISKINELNNIIESLIK